MSTTPQSACGRLVEYDYGNKKATCGSATGSGAFQCQSCRNKDTDESVPHQNLADGQQPEKEISK